MKAPTVAAMFLYALLATAPSQAQLLEPLRDGSHLASPSWDGTGLDAPIPSMPERSGIPVPVGVRNSGGPRVGAAGVGWTIPVSYVQVSDSIAGRLPRPDGSVAFKAHVLLHGKPIEFVAAEASGRRFVSRDRAASAELIRESDGVWLLRQGVLEYAFGRLTHARPDRFYLIQIGHLAAPSRVELDYQVFVGQDGLVEVLLDRVTYNFASNDDPDCAASRLDLAYASPAALGLAATSGPLADPSGVLDIEAAAGPTHRAHVVRKLLHTVTLQTKSGSCSSGWRTAGRSIFLYRQAPDTGLPTLAGVDAIGTSAAAATPAARYEYGSRSSLAGEVTYDPDESRFAAGAIPADMKPSLSDVESIRLPAGTANPMPLPTDRRDIALQQAYRPDGDRSLREVVIEKTWFSFTDMTGDGLADLVYRSKDSGVLMLARNASSRIGLNFDTPVALFQQGNFDTAEINAGSAKLPLGMRMTANLRPTNFAEGNGAVTTTLELVRLTDFNGDGRLDIVDARGGNSWVVYINAPSNHPSGPAEYTPNASHPIFWMRNEVNVSGMAAQHAAENERDGDSQTSDNGSIGGGRFPISWSISGSRQARAAAYLFKADAPYCYPSHVPGSGVDKASCTHNQAAWKRKPEHDLRWTDRPAETHVLLDLRDTNGDGYPDILSASVPSALQFFVRFVAEVNSPSQGQPTCDSQGQCRPIAVSALSVPPWHSSLNYTQPDRTLIAWESDYEGYLTCLATGASSCSFTTPAGSASNCYSPFGAQFGCAVEDVTTAYQGEVWGLADIPKLQLRANHNFAGVRLGSQSTNQKKAFVETAALLANSAACAGLDHYVSRVEYDPNDPANGNYSTTLKCAAVDVNADGLLDLAGEEMAHLGTGDGFSPFKVESVLGGEVSYRVPTCDAPGKVHPGYGHLPGSAPSPPDPVVIAMPEGADLDGDGFRDRQWAFGTGALKNGASAEGAWSETVQWRDAFEGSPPTCNSRSIRTKLLVDVTGDGRPDSVRVDGGSLKVRQPLGVGLGQTDDVGMLSAGRLVEATDGHGRGVRFRYENAKLNPWSLNLVPWAQIVVASETPFAVTSTGEVIEQEPVRRAFGMSSSFYSTHAERFVPTGYQFVATVRGAVLSSGPNVNLIKGQGSVAIARGFTGTLEKRDLLAGTPDQVRKFEGYFESADDLLKQFMYFTFAESTSYVGNSDNFTDVAVHAPAEAISGYAGSQCSRVDFPYGGAQSAVSPGVSDRDCLARYVLIPRSSVSWEGFSYKAQDFTEPDVNGYDALLRRYVRSKTAVETWDSYGRPTLVREERSPDIASDDVCVTIDYAVPEGVWKDKAYAPLTVVARESYSDCAGNITKARAYTYVGSTSVGDFRGLPEIAKVVETYEDNGSTRTREIGRWEYNAFGQPTAIVRTNDSPLPSIGAVSQTASLSYDAFSIVVTGESVSASDVADYGSRVAYAYDPVSYARLSTTDLNTGLKIGVEYDDFGRIKREYVQSPTATSGSEQDTTTYEYFGQDAPAHDAKKIKISRTLSWPLPGNPAGTETKLVQYVTFDAFGRAVQKETVMAGGQGSGSRVEWKRGFDKLGRVAHVYGPHAKGAHAGEPVTTYRLPLLRKEPYCQITAPAVRNKPELVTKVLSREPLNGVYSTSFQLPVTKVSLQQASACLVYGFSEGRRITFAINATSLESATPEAVSGTVQVHDASGQKIEQRTWDLSGALPTEQMRWTYNRYGHVERLRRYRKPSLTSPTQSVSWHYESDGLGRVTRYYRHAPSALGNALDGATFEYDQWDQVVRTGLGRVMTESGLAQGDVGILYDGFGRVTRRRSLDPLNDDGDVAPINAPSWRPDGQEIRYVYRAAFEPGAGKLARIERWNGGSFWTSAATYDGLGRVAEERRSNGTLTSISSYEYSGPSQISSVATRIHEAPDVDAERVTFTYDESGAPLETTYSFGAERRVLERVSARDIFSRPLVVERANGSVQSYSYAPSGRRELLSVLETLPGLPAASGNARSTTIEQYDALGRPTVVSSARVRTGGATVSVLAGVKQRYRYDALNRVQSFEQWELPSNALTHHETYTFDALGNLAVVGDVLGLDRQYVPLAFDKDRLCAVDVKEQAQATLPEPRDTACSVNYDKRGNVTAYTDPFNSRVRTISYNAFNEPTSVDEGVVHVGYIHDGLGAVGEQWIGNQRLRKIGSHAERFGNSGIIWENVLSPSVSRRGGPGTMNLFYQGSSANVAQTVANSLGNEVAMRAFEPYGRSTESDEPTRLGAQAQRWHGEDLCAGANGAGGCNINRVYRMGPRLYDAGLGRFLQRDPLVIPRTASSVNPYGYSFQNPLLFSDASGLDPGGMMTIEETIMREHPTYNEAAPAAVILYAVAKRLFDVTVAQEKSWAPNVTQDGVSVLNYNVVGPENSLFSCEWCRTLKADYGVTASFGNVGYTWNTKGGELGVSLFDAKYSLPVPKHTGLNGTRVHPGSVDFYGSLAGAEFADGEKPKFAPVTGGVMVTRVNGPLTASYGGGIGLDPFRYEIKCEGGVGACLKAGSEILIGDTAAVAHPSGTEGAWANALMNAKEGPGSIGAGLQREFARDAALAKGRAAISTHVTRSLNVAPATSVKSIPRVVCTSEPEGVVCF